MLRVFIVRGERRVNFLGFAVMMGLGRAVFGWAGVGGGAEGGYGPPKF